jgi:Reverse transcriptase (RNA-dependent DNA polymerase)/gag-polypeptide of LTR copia-type
MDSTILKKRPVDTLTYDNSEEWFYLFGEWSKGEGIDFVLRKTVHQYAHQGIQPFAGFGTGTTPRSTDPQTPVDIISRPLDVQDLLESLGIKEEIPLRGQWDITRLEKWSKAEAKIRYVLTICVDDIDSKALREFKTVKLGWEALWVKYSKIRPATAREDQIKLTNYQWEESQTIDDAWIELKTLRRKVVNANPRLGDAYDEEALLQFLLPALPDEYAITVATLDAQPNLTVQDKLVALRNREDVLRVAKAAEDKALAAKQSAVPKQSQDDSKCKFCQRGKHDTDECAFRKAFDEIMDAVTRKQIRRAHSSDKRGNPQKRDHPKKSTHSSTKKPDHRSDRTVRFADQKDKKRSAKREHGHTAHEDSAGESSDDYTTTDSSEDELVEHAHLTRDEIRKIPYSYWCSDSCASSHMTDDKSLFRSPLVPIRRRTILVGGGQLFADWMGTAELRVEGSGSILISNVLYVPRLGVNLLSSKKLCSKGLIFTGDDKHMAFWRNQEKVLEASVKGGVYILSWVKPNLVDNAFYGTESNDLAEINSHTSYESDNPQDQEPSQPVGCDELNECLHLDDDRAFIHDEEIDSDSDNTKTDANKTNKTDLERYRLWHERCVHAGPEVIRNLHKRTTLKKVRVPNDREACITCKLAKMRKKMSKELSPWKETILALVHADIGGPFHTSLQGNQYMAKLVDSASRLVWVILGKDRKDIVRNLRNWKKLVEKQSGLQIMGVRIDNATELKALLQEWLTTDGIREENTVVHSSFQNGPAEKSIQTSENDFRAMLKDQGLPLEFWDEAAMTGAYVRNRIMNGPRAGDKTFSPYEAFYGQAPTIDHFRRFGCQAVGYVDPKSLPGHDKRNPKQVDKGRLGVFMGYVNETTKQWRLYAPDLGRTITVTTIDFLESKRGGDLDLRIRGARPQGTPSDPVNRIPVGRPKETLKNVELPPKEKLNNFEIRIPVKPTDPTDAKPKANQNPQCDPQPSTSNESRAEPRTTEITGPPKAKRRASTSEEELDTRIFKKIKAFLARAAKVKQVSEMDALEMGYAAAILKDGDVEVSVPIPKSYRAAINDSVYGPKWRAAIEEELKALGINGTWREEIPPKGVNLVSTKWVFLVKVKSDGTLDRFKARLVARGFSQVYGIDYFETFAPTVRMDTLRVFLAVAAEKDWELIHMDIKNAFTESHLKEQIYLAPPQGVKVKDGYALRVLRSLYGLKQSARDWNHLCRDYLLTIGFKQSLSDPCLFTHQERQIRLLVYVDDILCATEKIKDSDWVYSKLSQRFTTKNLGEATKLLGIRITRNRKSREIYLDQEQYLEGVLRKFGIDAAKYRRRGTPMRDYENLRPTQPEEERHDANEYQQVIGSLMYAMVHTRPDIAFTLGKLSQFMQDPSERHWMYLKALMRYIRSSLCLRLRFGRGRNRSLIIYTDADWAGQKSDRKSTSGGVAMLYGGPVCWLSKVQRSVATSSTESEYIAQSTNAKTTQWLAQILRDIGYPELIGEDGKTVQILADNQGAIALAKNPHLHERSRHIDICYHYVRDLVQRGKVKIEYIPTAEMVADGFTKPLERTAFDRFKDQLGMVNGPARG